MAVLMRRRRHHLSDDAHDADDTSRPQIVLKAAGLTLVTIGILGSVSKLRGLDIWSLGFLGGIYGAAFGIALLRRVSRRRAERRLAEILKTSRHRRATRRRLAPG